MKIKAVFPGTFDPFSNGHLDLVKRGSALFDELVVAVAASPSKHTMFSLEQRVEIIKESLNDCPNVTVTGFSGMLIQFLKDNQANVLLRGIRSVTDYDYEAQLTGLYHEMMPELEVVFLNTRSNVAFISSTLIRETIIHKGDVSRFVPDSVLRRIKS